MVGSQRALLVLGLAGAPACTYTYPCVATCDGGEFSGYAGGNFSESSVQNAVNACVSALQTAGCVSPKVPACACVQN